MAQLLVGLDGTHADVRMVTKLAYQYMNQLIQRIPLLRVIPSEVFQQLGNPGIDSFHKIKAVPGLWSQIAGSAQSHYNSLLAAHQLLVAVADVSQLAADMLTKCAASTHPLLLSTGHGLLSSFMELLCATVRMALLLDDLPRQQIAVLLYVVRDMEVSAAADDAELQGPGVSPTPVQPAPNTDLPVYKSASMVQFLQGLIHPLTSRIQQVMELSIAPAVTALTSTSSNHSQSRKTFLPAADIPSAATTIPHMFHLQAPDPSLDCRSRQPHDLYCLPAGAKPGAGGNKYMLMGPGGMRLNDAYALCQQYTQLQEWVLFSHLVCPSAAAYAGALPLLTDILSKEILLPLHEERFCWIGAQYLTSFATPSTSPSSLGVQRKQKAQVMVETRRAVQSAVATAVKDAWKVHADMRSDCVDKLLSVYAACKANPELLATNMPMLLGLLAVARHLVAWHFRHADAWRHLPPCLAQLIPHDSSTISPTASVLTSDIQAGQSDQRVGAADNTRKAPSGQGSRILNKFMSLGRNSSRQTLTDMPRAITGAPHACPNQVTDGTAGPNPTGGSQSVLELIETMQNMVDLLVEHMPAVQHSLQIASAQLLQRHIVPGHLRLQSSKTTHAGLPITLQDVQTVMERVQRLVAAATQLPDPALLSSLQYSWRMLQLHTLLLPAGTVGSSGEATPVPMLSARTSESIADLAQLLQNLGPEQSQDSVPDWLETRQRVKRRQATNTTAAGNPAQVQQRNQETLQATQAPHNRHNQGEVGSWLQPAGLQAAQIAAITQDPYFLNALQEVCQVLQWCSAYHATLKQHAGLSALKHHPHQLADAVSVVLSNPQTAHLSLAAVRALHWMSEDDTDDEEHSVGDTPDSQTLASELATQFLDCTAACLRTLLAPLVSPSNIETKETASTQTSRRGTAETANIITTTEPSLLSQILPLCMAMAQTNIVPITKNMAVVPQQYLREVLSDSLATLLGNLTAEVPRRRSATTTDSRRSSGMVTSSTISGKDKDVKRQRPTAYDIDVPRDQDRCQLGGWQPTMALQRVQEYLELCAQLQPLLGKSMQYDLMRVLYAYGPGCLSADGRPTADGHEVFSSADREITDNEPKEATSPASTTVARPAMISRAGYEHSQLATVAAHFLQGIVSWITTNVLEDTSNRGCMYSARMGGFVATGTQTNSAASTDGKQSSNNRTNAVSNAVNNANGPSITPPAPANNIKPNIPSGALAMLKSRLGKASDVNSNGNNTVTTSSASHTLQQRVGSLATGSQSDLQNAAQDNINNAPNDTYKVLLSVQDLENLLSLFGPQAASLLAAPCTELLEGLLKNLDMHLATRHTSLLQLSRQLSAEDLQETVAAISNLVTAVGGPFSTWEMAKVHSNLTKLSRCLGFRQALGSAMHRAATRHAGLWSDIIPHLQIPEHSAATAIADKEDVDKDASQGNTPLNGESGIQRPSQQLQTANIGAAQWPAAVDWDSAVQIQTPDQQHDDNTKHREPQPRQPCSGDVEQAASRRAYTDMWQLPCDTLWSQGTDIVGHDPLLSQLLAGLIREPFTCERWALLPLLLGLCVAPSNKSRNQMPSTLDPYVNSNASEAHYLVLNSMMRAWHTAVTEGILHSPSAIDSIVSSGFQALLDQYQWVARLASGAAAKRNQPASVAAQIATDADNDADQSLGCIAGLPVDMWASAFSASLRG